MGSDLTAQLTSDGAAGSCYQNTLALHIGKN